MLTVHVWDDQETHRKSIASNLNRAFGTRIAAKADPIWSENWRELAEEWAQSGSAEFWIIDLNLDRMSPKGRKACRDWMLEQLAELPELQALYERERKGALSTIEHGGFALAIYAWRNKIPFVYSSIFTSHSPYLCPFLAGGASSVSARSFNGQLLCEEVPSDEAETQILRLARVIADYAEGSCSIALLDADSWRSMRGGDYPNGGMARAIAEELVLGNPDLASVGEDLRRFHPRHTVSGGAGPQSDADRLQSFVGWLFPQDVRQILEMDLGYRWSEEFDKRIHEAPLLSPPGRALLQNTAEPGFGGKSPTRDLTQYIAHWRETDDVGRRIGGVEWQDGVNLRHDYLWFNLPAALAALKWPLVSDGYEDSYRVAFVQQDWDGIDPVRAPHGMLILAFLSGPGHGRYYNPLFPAKDQPCDLKPEMAKTFGELFRHGAGWVFYSNQERNSDNIMWHLLLPPFSPMEEAGPRYAFQGTPWEAEVAPPTLAVYFPAECIKSPFRNDAEDGNPVKSICQIPVAMQRRTESTPQQGKVLEVVIGGLEVLACTD